MIADWGTGVRWWGWVPGIIATAVFWALVIWAIVVLARWAVRRERARGSGRPDGRDTGAPGTSRAGGRAGTAVIARDTTGTQALRSRADVRRAGPGAGTLPSDRTGLPGVTRLGR